MNMSDQDRPPQPPFVPVAPGTPAASSPNPSAPMIVKKVHPASIVLAAVGGAALLISICTFAASAGKSATPAGSPSVVYSYVTASPAPVAPVKTAAPTAAATVKPSAPAPPPPTVPTIGEGTWTVGTDFAPGKYRTNDTVGPDCYWAISKSGSNGNEIIANGIPGGGKPTVTLLVGQDFTSQRCGTWTKVG